MLVLFETAAGYALFQVLDEGKLKQTDTLFQNFETPEKAQKVVSLKKFSKFSNTTEALSAATALVEGKLGKGLRKFLKKNVISKDVKDKLAVPDSKLASAISSKLNIPCIHDATILELLRCMRSQVGSLLTGVQEGDMKAMTLGLSHSLSRYKLKFSPDKVDTMIVQAIALLDDLDKELNTYAMRVREWYGWHFPEATKIIPDNILFAKVVKKMGIRTNAANTNFSDILTPEMETEIKEASIISMGTEVSEEDISNILELCDQVISISEYRTQLYDYLKNRMEAIAPNLTVLVGELVGARLIAHAGSLINLAKHPASTVQILGAEKALFRALKTKHATPKYGLIYHASLIGQTSTKFKGKVSRLLAAKASLAVRVDALGEQAGPTIGIENRAKVEARVRQLEGKPLRQISGTGKQLAKYDHKRSMDDPASLRTTSVYNTAVDSTLGAKSVANGDKTVKVKKEKNNTEQTEKKVKKTKKAKSTNAKESMDVDAQEGKSAKSSDKPKKKKEKSKIKKEPEEAPVIEKKRKREEGDSEKKKKKKKKKASESD